MIILQKKTTIFVGYSCNSWCRFCIDLNKRHINLNTDEILYNIRKAKKDGSDTIEIIGGEVTIRKDFWIIMRFIKSLKFKHVYLVTNGIRFSEYDFAKKLYELNVLNSIVFSIHGHNPQLHDFLTRTKGSFKRLIKGINNWISLGFDTRYIGTNTAIVKYNYKYLMEIGKLIKRLKCFGSSEFIFADPNEGGVHDNFEELMPRISEAAPYMRKLLDWGNNNGMVYRVRYVPLCYFKEYIETNNISELMEKKIYSKVIHSAPDFVDEDVITNRQISGRMKTEKCKGCKLYDICEGLWVTYLENRGDEELKPVI